MELSSFIRGIVIGFSIAAPVGPIGILCIRRTIANGRLSGLVSGLGAATADAFYGSLAAMGLSFLILFLINQQTWLQLLGGAFLMTRAMKLVPGRGQNLFEFVYEALGDFGRETVEKQAQKRVAVVIHPDHVATWDHRKMT